MCYQHSLNRCYGYKHWTLEEKPRCFYVGKGTLGRADSHGSRNHKWHAIVKRFGFRVEVCIGPITNEAACDWEIANIALAETFSACHDHHTDDIGCNFTIGGDGVVGRKQSCAERELRSKRMKQRFAENPNAHTIASEALKRRWQNRTFRTKWQNRAQQRAIVRASAKANEHAEKQRLIQDEVTQYAAQYAAGSSIRNIARMHNVSVNRVLSRLRLGNVVMRKRRGTMRC